MTLADFIFHSRVGLSAFKEDDNLVWKILCTETPNRCQGITVLPASNDIKGNITKALDAGCDYVAIYKPEDKRVYFHRTKPVEDGWTTNDTWYTLDEFIWYLGVPTAKAFMQYINDFKK